MLFRLTTEYRRQVVTPGSSLTERLSLATACAHRTWNELEVCLPTITNVLTV
ncbi:hypothetical protein [Brucella pituitosa]|uniref:hypothetical protein n=1 Tax=Brucella pituitosa TaxID=571256 RepID=UPI0013E34EDC|nr:hypothetical protein [Brucella pituitosa]